MKTTEARRRAEIKKSFRAMVAGAGDVSRSGAVFCKCGARISANKTSCAECMRSARVVAGLDPGKGDDESRLQVKVGEKWVTLGEVKAVRIGGRDGRG